MAAPKQHTKKGRKKKRSSFLCSFGACFGFSTKVSADHGDGKPGRPALPVNDRHPPAAAAAEVEIVSRSKEIHVVEDDEEKRITPSADEFVTNNKTDDKTCSKSKKREEFSPITKRGEKQNNDTWTNHSKLWHSVSLPLPRQKREKEAVGGERKGKRGEEEEVAAVGGEFDSTFGAVIIMVTLVVMVIWGKMCAILCTAAWLYFIPRYRENLDRSYALKFKNIAAAHPSLHFDSREHNKRVVLQGLLHRNQNLS